MFITLRSSVINLFVAMPGLGQGHKEEIIRLKNSVPVCLCAFDPQATPFRGSSWFRTGV